MRRAYDQRVVVIGKIDNTGPILLDENFLQGLTWTFGGAGSDWNAEVSRENVYQGRYALKLQTRATTPAANDYFSLTKNLHVLQSKGITFQSVLNYQSNALISLIRFSLDFYDGTYRVISAVQYLPPEAKWQYLNENGSYSDITGGNITLLANAWHRILFSFNFGTCKYGRLQCEDLDINISTLQGQKIASAVGRGLEVVIRAETETAAQLTIYIDNICITGELE